jgi:hypothetical protein
MSKDRKIQQQARALSRKVERAHRHEQLLRQHFCCPTTFAFCCAYELFRLPADFSPSGVVKNFVNLTMARRCPAPALSDRGITGGIAA